MSARVDMAVSLVALFEGTGIIVPDLAVTDITTNSSGAVRDGMFLACRGMRSHGLHYLDEAIAAGAAVVAWEPAPGVTAPDLPAGVVGVEVPDLRQRLGTVADRFFNYPSAELAVTGVTGTNGKSTTACLVAQALTALGQPAGYMGTLGFGVGPALEPSALTTPGCVEVHRRLRSMADRGASQVVMEVSSHALDQRRVDGVRFETAALTNLSRDHLDYHGDMARYAAAKARLFTDSGIRTAVLNVGDAYVAELARRVSGAGDSAEVLSVALVGTEERPGAAARLIGRLTGTHAAGIGVHLSGDFGDAILDSALWGRFNAENLVVATGILLARGFGLDRAVGALRECVAPPGRMELIRADRGPAVVVDYAHTPDALGKALDAVRDHTGGRVWCVFGCGGDRDRGKRAQMGAVAGELADHVVVTDDNPRDEDPEAIIADILGGTTRPLRVIRDRGDAIGFAIRAAGANDAVLIAGKGHESTQLLDGRARRFSDAQAARAALGRVA